MKKETVSESQLCALNKKDCKNGGLIVEIVLEIQVTHRSHSYYPLSQ